MRPDMLDLKMDNIEEDSPAFQTASYRHIV